MLPCAAGVACKHIFPADVALSQAVEDGGQCPALRNSREEVSKLETIIMILCMVVIAAIA